MGESSFQRPLRVAAVVSLAVFVASCGGTRRDAAPVIMNGAAPDRIEATPVAPMAPIPRTSRPSPAGPSQAGPSGPGQRVVVRPGQSVGYLAREYGVTRKAIIEANNLTPPEYKIEIGRTLVIPGGGPGGNEARAPAQAASPERTAAAARPGRGGEVIPLDDPPAVPRKTAEAPPKGRLSPPAAEPAARTAQPAGRAAPPATAESPAKGGQFPWPVRGRIVAGYGASRSGNQNAGINIAAARGAPVRSIDSGTVAYAGNEIHGYGNLVLVKHPSGFISAYAHLDEMLVKRGDTISGGQTIGKVGNTGGVSEPQLHFELRRGKKAVDPREFLSPAPSASGGRGGEG